MKTPRDMTLFVLDEEEPIELPAGSSVTVSVVILKPDGEQVVRKRSLFALPLDCPVARLSASMTVLRAQPYRAQPHSLPAPRCLACGGIMNPATKGTGKWRCDTADCPNRWIGG